MIATTEKKVVRCAIYTRKSNEDGLDQAFNSLHAQRAMCESYIASFASEGWTALATEYSDAGITGGTMERPGLQNLLVDIEAGRVDVVVIYRLDRLSRSLRDFLNMMETFDRRKVSFASVTERIDTTSSAGRLFLNMILAFAQFEREVAAERICDKIASAKRKGKYVGGRPLLGYDVDREKMRLVVNPEEAKLVRLIFQRFCQLGSCMKLAHELNAKGRRMKAWTSKKGRAMGGGTWLKTDVHHLLTNPRYIGLVVHKGESFTGEHEAIIDRKTWERVQGILSKNRNYRANQTRKATAAILKGILRCGCCDAAMVPTYTVRRGKRYHYYLCHAVGKDDHDSCAVKSVAAGQIEGAVFTYLKDIFADPEMVARTFRATRNQTVADGDAAKREKAAIEKHLADLRKAVRRLVRATDGKAEGALSAELRALNDEYADAEKRLEELTAQPGGQDDMPSEQDVAEALRTIEPLWEELFPAEKERIVRLLVETVTVRPDGLSIRLRPTGLITLAAEVAPERAEEPELEEAIA
jgi:site-specific DNA recombinase